MKFITNLPEDSVRKASDTRLVKVVWEIKFEGRAGKLHLILYQAYFVDREREGEEEEKAGKEIMKKGTKKRYSAFIAFLKLFLFMHAL